LVLQAYDGERFEAIMKRLVAEIRAQRVKGAQFDAAVTEAVKMSGLGGDE